MHYVGFAELAAAVSKAADLGADFRFASRDQPVQVVRSAAKSLVRLDGDAPPDRVQHAQASRLSDSKARSLKSQCNRLKTGKRRVPQ